MKSLFKRRIDINSLKELKIVRYDSFNDKLVTNTLRNDYIWRIYFTNDNILDVNDSKFYTPDISNFKTRFEDEQIALNSTYYITYRVKTGQIGLFYAQKEYQNSGLGKQILLRVIEDIKNNVCDKVFAITSENNKFWANVYNKSFTWSERPDISVTGSGYFLELNKFDIEKYK